MWNRKVFIRIVEVLLCISCVVALRVTDDESRRVFHYLRNRNREWSLLNNVTWGTIGSALATATCGGYVIITAGLLVAAATGELAGRKTEIFLLGLGIILFGIVGALALASIDSIPEDLVDNGAVLGALCLITALVFIADLLMAPPRKKDKPQDIKIYLDKESTGETLKPKQPSAKASTEKETKSSREKEHDKKRRESLENDSGKINEAFEKLDNRRSAEESAEERKEARPKVQNSDNSYPEGKEPSREYTENFENGQVSRDARRYRESETLQKRAPPSRSFESDGAMENTRVIYRNRDIYQRPIDEVDTPPFPTDHATRSDATFAKVVNPGVKIMRVDRDVQDNFENYRYSDTSQYDNVPVRMRGASSGILRKGRDVSFNVPPPPFPVVHDSIQERSKDEIEMLEECFSVLKSTGTQTATAHIPSSPTDPGYVRHTASNWPNDSRPKTPGPSPRDSQ